MTTIYDIARRLGIAPSTVSRAMSGTGYVSAGLRERIVQTAKEMKYHPNQLARGLSRKQSLTIGLAVPDIANPFFAAMSRAVEDVANKNDYNVILCNTDGDPVKEKAYVQLLRSKKVDGVVFVSARGVKKNVMPLLDEGIPVVISDRKMPVKADHVYVDNVQGGYLICKHVLSEGHRLIGLVTSPKYISSGIDKLAGCKKALAEHGIELDERYICKDREFTQQAGYRMTKRLLRLSRPPTAVMCWNDILAVGAIQAMNEESIKIPQDIALTGYDDSFFAAFTHPGLTTVSQPVYEMGLIACQLLIERITDKDRPTRSVILSPKLIIRESSRRA